MKKLLILLVLIPYIGITQNLSYSENYTHKKQYKSPYTEAQLPNALVEDEISTIVYYDGLGRPVQTQMLKQGGRDDSGQYVDLMVPVAYDSYGRQSKDYLSFPSSGNSGVYYDTATLIEDLKVYYANAYPEDINALRPNPNSNKLFENSPLNRVKAQGAPGKYWRASGDFVIGDGEVNKFIRFEYGTNAEYEVKRFRVNHPNNNTEMTELVYEGDYPANTLFKTITKDENWEPSTNATEEDDDINNDHTIEEFKDKDGRVILKRAYNNHIPHDTYYVYDDYGNLTYVIPPEASDHIINEGGQGFIANTTNYPWTDLMQVSKSFAKEYETLLKDYDNEALLNADLDNAYGGQGGFTVSTTTSGDLIFSINMASTTPLDIKTGAIVALKPFGKFKDTELGRTNDGNYIFSIKNNSIWVDYAKRGFKAPTDITALNYTFSNGTKLTYNENYAWAEITAINATVKSQYMNALREANIDNTGILDADIANSYNAQGGLNVSIDANDVITLSVNINTTTPLRLKQGVLFPLNTKRRFPDKTIGNIGDYTFYIRDNSIYVEGVTEFTSLSGTRYAASDPPNYTTDTATLEGLCYIYHYDYRNRLIEKKIPGKDWEYIVYDMQDRPVGTQDGNLRINNDWLFTKYDAFGRVTYTGLQKNTSWTRISLQNSINNNATLNANNNNSFRDQTGFVMNGITVYYTKQTSWPMGFSDVLTVNYYDDYNVNLSSDLHYQDSYGQTQIASTRTLPTVSKVRVLESNTNYGNHWVTSVSYYDDKARPTFAITKNNYLNTTDWVKTQMDDFTGKVLETTSYHHKTGQTPIQIVDSFTYDRMDRLLTHVQSINGEASELIVNNHYDVLGQLVTKDVGGDVAALPEQSNGLQSVDYNYNIRGWLKQINDVNQLGNDLFGFKINYNTTEIAGAEALYNGNISETHWVTANDHIKRNYYYKYDGLNRINEAIYGNIYQGNDPLTIDESYNLLGVDYDKNGNITSLQRTGRYYQTQQYTGMEHYDMIDNLSYVYAPLSNKLLSVSDAASNAFGFKDGNTGVEDYQYDINGNMTVDANKGITGISYNHLNLPVEITTANGNIAYIYDASGVKLEKVVTEGSSVTSTKYAGGYIYKDDNLEFFSQPEGYIEPDGTRFKYVYQYKDHLGNIRLSYTQNENTLEIVEENHYYPFGLKHKGYNNVINGTDHPYGYNGKEEQNEFSGSLQWLDYGARNFDASLGRWFGVDPFAELMRNQSPYNFGFNNPIYFSDYGGTIPWPVPEMFKNWIRRLGSPFGMRTRRGKTKLHAGIDINFSGGGNTDYEAPIVATHSGKVTFIEASNTGSAGRYLEITSPDGSFKTRYLHLSSVAVTAGQEISEGQSIGLLGGSGFGKDLGYTAHLHYEIHQRGSDGSYSAINPVGASGTLIDPQLWIKPHRNDFYDDFAYQDALYAYEYVEEDRRKEASQSTQSETTNEGSREPVSPLPSTITPAPIVPIPTPAPGGSLIPIPSPNPQPAPLPIIIPTPKPDSRF